jgi:metal-responsive CopG/Arc/MetJ family transcriptional regulator
MAKKTQSEPETTETTGLSVRVPVHLLARIDALTSAEKRTRGNMVRVLLEEALDSRDRDNRENR